MLNAQCGDSYICRRRCTEYQARHFVRKVSASCKAWIAALHGDAGDLYTVVQIVGQEDVRTFEQELQAQIAAMSASKSNSKGGSIALIFKAMLALFIRNKNNVGMLELTPYLSVIEMRSSKNSQLC
ncbi:MAG: hypothetical protein ACXU7H_02085 [Burkholderiaceae bacterium]